MKKSLLTLIPILTASSLFAQVNAVRFFAPDTNSNLANRTTNFNIDLSGNDEDDDSQVFFGFNDIGDTAWSTNTTGDYPYALYGGFIGETHGNSNRNLGTYSLNSSGFQFRYQPDNEGESGRLTIAIVFESSQTGLQFDSNSYLRIGGGNTWQTDASLDRYENLGETRWLVRNGSTYYVSETQFNNSNAAGRLLDGADIAATNWAVYDPSDAFDFNLSLNFNTSSSSLTDLNAFGVITYKDALESNRKWLQFRQFEAVAIPEPGTLVLVGIALGSLLLFRRRR